MTKKQGQLAQTPCLRAKSTNLQILPRAQPCGGNAGALQAQCWRYARPPWAPQDQPQDFSKISESTCIDLRVYICIDSLCFSASAIPSAVSPFPAESGIFFTIMTSEGISKSEVPVYHTEQMSNDDNTAIKGVGSGAAGWAPEKRAAVEKSMKRKLDARCSLFVLIYIMNYLDR